MDNSGEFPRVIETSDIDPAPTAVGGTKLVIQRHGKYERSTDMVNVGSLTEEGQASTYSIGKSFFNQMFDSIPAQERNAVDFLVVASDTQYERGGRRSIETANQVIGALKDELSDRGLDESQLLNTSGNIKGEKGPRPMAKLREPQMFNESPDFVQFLAEKYGDRNLDFWIAFEEDKERSAREEMGAEGPDQIADRLKFSTEVLTEYARLYHKKNPGKRLVIWAATHYDTISPFVKREIFGLDKTVPLGVDYGAGISVNIDSNGNRTTQIAGKEYSLSNT